MGEVEVWALRHRVKKAFLKSGEQISDPNFGLDNVIKYLTQTLG
jgi:hypothetical protein